MKRMSRRYAVLGLLLVGMLIVAGCFETKYSIVNPDKAVINAALLGNWNSDAFSADGREAGLIVRNIDGKMYYAEWRMKDSPSDLVRGVGNSVEIQGATFLQLRGLSDSASIDDKWLIVRADLAGNTLKIRQLDEDFFKTQKIESDDQLRKVLSDNVNNDKMYSNDGVITATRKS